MGLFTRREREEMQVKVIQTAKSFAVAGKDSILNEALADGVPFPHSCTVGTCGTCKAKLLSGKIRAISDFAVALSAEELRDGYILPCQAIARSSVELDVAGMADVPDHPLRHRQGTIVRHRPLTHDIVELGVDLDGPLDYTAGQYAELRLPDCAPRAYSFSVAPNRRPGDHASFFIRKVPGGEFTEWLFAEDRTGTPLTVEGPFGNLWLRPGNGPVLCVAGGSGLAPIKALLEAAHASKVQREFVFVFGAREVRDLYCVDEVQALGESWGAEFTFVPVLSEEDPGTGWTGARGLVTDVIAGFPQQFLTTCDAYVCGPPPMVDAVEAQLTSIRSDTEFFHADRFLDNSLARR